MFEQKSTYLEDFMFTEIWGEERDIKKERKREREGERKRERFLNKILRSWIFNLEITISAFILTSKAINGQISFRQILIGLRQKKRNGPQVFMQII